MDVRCEQCQTEYELDEARVTEQGVTVKCTQCGHMFKVRRRGATPPPPSAGTAAAAAAAAATTMGSAATQPMPAAPPAPGAPSVWLIRNNIGEIRRFRELTTLQQWIVERKVDRECEISRTGETWKRLGEIAELASFFHLVDQADQRDKQRQRRLTDPTGTPITPEAAAPEAAGPRGTRPITSGAGVGITPGAKVAATPGRQRPATAQPPGSRQPTPPPPPPAPALRSAVPAPVGGDATGGWAAQPMTGRPAAPAPAFTAGSEVPVFDQSEPKFVGGPLRAQPGARSTGAWATGAQAERQDPGEPADDDESATPEPAKGEWYAQGELAKKAHPPRPDAAPSRMASEEDTLKHLKDLRIPGADPEEDEPLDIAPEYVPRNRGPLIMAIGAGLILGAVFGVWFFKLRKKKSAPAAAAQIDAAVIASAPPPDAAAPVVSPIARAVDAAVTAPLSPAQAAIARLDDNTDAAWTGAETELRALSLDAKHAAVATAGLALLELARAEARLDEAELLETDAAAAQAAGQPDAASQARRDAKRKRTEAAQGIARGKASAARAQGMQPDAPEVALAQAELGVATKAAPAVVEKSLKTVFSAQADDPRGSYLRALTLLAAQKPADAEAALIKLDKLPRALYRLAVVRARAANSAGALEALELLLALQPSHGRGLALRAQLGRTPLASVSPTPSASPGVPGVGPAPGVESYDVLVRRADSLAENGKSDAAVDVYKKALEARPKGVEALSGLGYALLDRRDYEGALAYFDAALAQSPSYSDALIGVAETYKLKGDKDQAIAAYKKYLDRHPSGGKVAMAKRNIQDLGGEVEPSPSPTPESSPSPSPEASPSPTPEPSAPPAPAPSPSP